MPPLNDMITYKKLFEYYKKQVNLESHFFHLAGVVQSMFDYSGNFPFDVKYFEKYLTLYGNCAIQKKGDSFIVAPFVARTGNLDIYGDGTEGIAVTWNGEQIDGKINEDVVICYNNLNRTPDFDIYIISEMLAEIDKSILANIKWTRVAPLIKCDDSKTATAVEKIISKIFDGDIKNIVSDNVIERIKEFSANNSETIEPIFLTTPEKVKDLQYLADFADYLRKVFFSKYGQNPQVSSKHAQVTMQELTGYDSISWLVPLEKLREREKFIATSNEIFGSDWKVAFSEPWLKEYNKYMSSKTEDLQNDD